MKTLTIASAVSVLCTVSIWLCVALGMTLRGQVDLDELFVVMVMYPTLVGLIASLVGAAVGAAILIRRSGRGWSGTTMAAGQLLTWALAVAIIVWALAFGSTGWELLAVPFSLMLGQIIVAVGLFTVVIRRRRPAPHQTT